MCGPQGAPGLNQGRVTALASLLGGLLCGEARLLLQDSPPQPLPALRRSDIPPAYSRQPTGSLRSTGHRTQKRCKMWPRACLPHSVSTHIPALEAATSTPISSLPLPLHLCVCVCCTHTLTHSPFSLFVVVMFYEVAANTELANAEPWRWGKCRVGTLCASRHSIFISPSICSLV